VNDFLIPSGAITTPPDSLQGSDDEERGRHLGNLAELQEALQSIELKRGHSPVRIGEKSGHIPANISIDTNAARSGLTPEARKISHSRSSSETALVQHASNLPVESPVQTSDDSDENEDDELRMKPPLLRKKSGELVKPALRPPSRRRPSSMPGTPTFSKAVHFNDQIEQVRHFLQVDRPIAVSAGSSPVENYDSESEYPFGYDDGHASRMVEWEIRLANFPSTETFERKTQPVKVERIFLSADNKTLIGNVAVANLAFHKLVVARFTLDYWKTTSEVVAEYNNDVRKKQTHDGYDRFNFNIKLTDQANLESKTLLLCVRYNVNGQEFWDNNNDMNYQVDFIKKTKVRTGGRGGMQGHGAGSLGAIPRSRRSPPTAPRPRSMPASFDDDFGNAFDSKYEFDSARALLGDSPNNTIRLKKKNAFAPRRSDAPGLGSRYDFGVSLTHALTTAQKALGERSGLPPKDDAKPGPAVIAGPRPDEIKTQKPDLKSEEYKELIQKFCFFGSGKTSPAQPQSPKPQHTDGAREYSDGSASSSPNSGSVSPSPNKGMSPLVDGANDTRSSSRSPNFLSRSSSPGPVTGSAPGDRTLSPLTVGYAYGQMHGGIFPDSHTPTAIRG